METGDSEVIKSSQKLFRVLEQLIEMGGAGVTEIAKETSLAKSTTHLHLQSLLATGYVIKRDDTYYPSLQLFEWGEKVRNKKSVYVKGRQEVDRLVDAVQGVAKLGVLENDTVRLAYIIENTGEMEASPVSSISTEFSVEPPTGGDYGGEYRGLLGKEMAIHATAIGKAILAELPQATVESIVDTHGLPKQTEHTITDKDTLFAELERIREQGHARDDEEWSEGIRCIGSAIVPDDQPVGGVSVSGPAARMDGEVADEVIRRIINTANIIEVKLSHA